MVAWPPRTCTLCVSWLYFKSPHVCPGQLSVGSAKAYLATPMKCSPSTLWTLKCHGHSPAVSQDPSRGWLLPKVQTETGPWQQFPAWARAPGDHAVRYLKAVGLACSGAMSPGHTDSKTGATPGSSTCGDPVLKGPWCAGQCVRPQPQGAQKASIKAVGATRRREELGERFPRSHAHLIQQTATLPPTMVSHSTWDSSQLIHYKLQLGSGDSIDRRDVSVE